MIIHEKMVLDLLTLSLSELRESWARCGHRTVTRRINGAAREDANGLASVLILIKRAFSPDNPRLCTIFTLYNTRQLHHDGALLVSGFSLGVFAPIATCGLWGIAHSTKRRFKSRTRCMGKKERHSMHGVS